MNITFEGKKAVVTGARQGIGAAVAIALAQSGAEVALLDLAIGEESEVVQTAKSLQNGCFGHRVDVSKEADVAGAFAQVRKRFQGLDILVNNAGITRDSTVKKMTAEQFMSVIEVNLLGAFLCAKEAAAIMRESGSAGSIVNLSSISPFEGNVGQANYAASKMGVIGFTRTLSQELSREGIRVNAVAPGFTITPMTDVLPEDIKERLIAGIPLKRAGRPEDIADAILFLASDRASFITGQVLHVNGGSVLY